MTKECCICQEERAKYKCPICKCLYCSINCCKMHKSVRCLPVEPGSNNDSHTADAYKNGKRKYDFPTEDTVCVKRLQELHHSTKLKECIKDPLVRCIMKSILSNSNPTHAIAMAMQEPVFLELANECLQVVEPPDEEKLS